MLNSKIYEVFTTTTSFGDWWPGSWTYLLFLTLLIVITISFRKYELSRIRFRNRLRIMNFETKKLKELDQLKSQFYSNISHEFRTPLTLIKGPLEQLREEEDDPQKKMLLEVMYSNTSRILELINQLLDLSRLESGNNRVRVFNGDLMAFVKGVTMSFASAAKKKSISLNIIEDPDFEQGKLADDFYFDPDILEKIIINLLSNAIKFTPAGGNVTVKVCRLAAKDDKEWLVLIIKDTGIGIPEDKLPFIYDRFYQVDQEKKIEYGGTGIGLAYVKQLVRAHRAKIHVLSSEGHGTTFILKFPVGRNHYLPGQILQPESIPVTESHRTTKTESRIESFFSVNNKEVNFDAKPLVQIIEDNPEVRKYIVYSVQQEFTILESAEAIDGFRLAEESIPDLIISDIMMPGLDGYELCKKLKSSGKTSHIPVILLTAKTNDADRIRGLEFGADDYLAKPFNVKELKTRIRNLINSRMALRQKFTSNSIIRPEEISVTTRDAALMEKLLGVVEKNIGNPAFSVEDLGREAGMSSSQIHRKLKATINMPANHFVRSVRMHKAMSLLRMNAGSISEISFMVGYEDPGYFTKTFRKFFGKLPSGITKVLDADKP